MSGRPCACVLGTWFGLLHILRVDDDGRVGPFPGPSLVQEDFPPRGR